MIGQACVRTLDIIVSFNPHYKPKTRRHYKLVGTNPIPHFTEGKLRHREVKEPAQGYRGSKTAEPGFVSRARALNNSSTGSPTTWVGSCASTPPTTGRWWGTLGIS